ncbi:MAG: bifunctional metallophosphatase/5'-nucleotidase [Culicoidibacterales bacterium]
MKIAIYHTSDLHGYVYPTNYVTEQQLGLLKIGSYFQTDADNYDATLKIDCGDLIQGSPFTHYLSKQTLSENVIIKALEAVGYDGYVLGNHEFNYGLDYLYTAYQPVADKVINANIEGLALETKPYQIFDYDGFKVACLGLTTSFIPNWENASNIAGVSFADPVEMYGKYEAELTAQADYIIVAYHGGFEKSLDETMTPTEKLTKENQGSELLEKFTSIDLVLSGHQHRSFMTKIGKVICSQPLNNGQNFGKIVLDTQTREVSAELVEVASLNQTINPELEQLFHAENVKLATYLQQEIGRFDQPMLIADIFQARIEGHPFVQLLHKIQIETSGADFSAVSLFDNAIGFDTAVTIRDVIVNYPYPNTLKVLAVTGEQLKAAVEKAASYFTLENGELGVSDEFIYPKKQHYNYDMFGGFTYEIDVTKPVGERVTMWLNSGEAFDMAQTYTIALNNYRATNTAIYPSYEHAEVVKDINLDIGELIMNYFQAHEVIRVDQTTNFKVITK